MFQRGPKISVASLETTLKFILQTFPVDIFHFQTSICLCAPQTVRTTTCGFFWDESVRSLWFFCFVFFLVIPVSGCRRLIGQRTQCRTGFAVMWLLWCDYWCSSSWICSSLLDMKSFLLFPYFSLMSVMSAIFVMFSGACNTFVVCVDLLTYFNCLQFDFNQNQDDGAVRAWRQTSFL